MNGSLVFVAGGLAFFAAFLLYLFFRFLWETGNERLNTRLQRIETEGEKISLRRRIPKTWAEKMDEAFETLVLQSGLDLKPNQAVAWMILVGTVLAVGAWFLREELWLVPLAFAVGVGAVFCSHARPVCVKNTDYRAVGPVCAVIRHRYCFAVTLCFVVNTSRTDRIYVSPVAYFLGMFKGISVDLACRGHHKTCVFVGGQLQ